MTHEECIEAVGNDQTLIIIKRQEDGNYKGWVNKGTIIEERQINPEYTLQALLLSDGKA